MSLIKCIECGHAISSQAISCPSCGAPSLASQVTTKHAPEVPGAVRAVFGVVRTFVTLAVVAGVAAVIVVIAVASKETNKGQGAPTEQPHLQAQQATQGEPEALNQQDSVAPPAPAALPVELTADQLYEDYQANEVVADQKYKGKLLVVTGTVYSINKDFTDEIWVAMETAHAYSHIRLSKVPVEIAVKLKKKDSITATCLGAGMVIDTPILKCGT